MAIKYFKLFDILNRRGITKSQMRIDLGLSTKTLAKISNHENINIETIDKICAYLDLQPGDVMEYINDKKELKDNCK